MHVNLLPRSFLCRLIVREKLRFWICIWTLCLGLAAVPCWWQGCEVASLSRQAKELEQRSTPYRLAQVEARRLRAQLIHLAEREQLLHALRGARCELTLLSAVTQSVAASQGEIQVTTLHCEPFTTPGTYRPPSQVVNDNTPTKRLVLKGLANNDQAVAHFISQLRDTGPFAHIELKAMTGGQASGSTVVEYHLECHL